MRHRDKGLLHEFYAPVFPLLSLSGSVPVWLRYRCTIHFIHEHPGRSTALHQAHAQAHIHISLGVPTPASTYLRQLLRTLPTAAPVQAYAQAQFVPQGRSTISHQAYIQAQSYLLRHDLLHRIKHTHTHLRHQKVYIHDTSSPFIQSQSLSRHHRLRTYGSLRIYGASPWGLGILGTRGNGVDSSCIPKPLVLGSGNHQWRRFSSFTYYIYMR